MKRSFLYILSLLVFPFSFMEEARGTFQETRPSQGSARMAALAPARNSLDSFPVFKDGKSGVTNKGSRGHWLRAKAPLNPLQEAEQSSVEESHLRQAAQEMEALFLDQLFQAMRQTVPQDSLGLDSPATRVYRQMLDSQYAQKAAERGGIGLAEQIIAYFKMKEHRQRKKERL